MCLDFDEIGECGHMKKPAATRPYCRLCFKRVDPDPNSEWQFRHLNYRTSCRGGSGAVWITDAEARKRVNSPQGEK